VYRQKYNARFLLKQSKCKEEVHSANISGAQQMRNLHPRMASQQDHKSIEDQIRNVVDQMVRQVSSSNPPVTKKEAVTTTNEPTNE
jgi:hypothetical protein